MLLPFKGRYWDMVRISAIPPVNLGVVSTLAIFNTITELLRLSKQLSMMSGRTCLPKIRYQLFYLLFELSALLLSSFPLCLSPSSLEKAYCSLDADCC
jgi:hypothetical protein